LPSDVYTRQRLGVSRRQQFAKCGPLALGKMASLPSVNQKTLGKMYCLPSVSLGHSVKYFFYFGF
jgi:hypothetical protein